MLPNEQIAQRFDELARILNEQGADVYRIAAWRHAAMSLRRLAEPASQLYEREGIEGLRKLPGVGDRIAMAIRGLIVTGKLPILERLRGEIVPQVTAEEVPVAELLDVDREYRESAGAGRLRKVAPRRFNPKGEAWLPVLHTERGARHYTALYSNTARAHELGKTADWVVIYWEGGGGAERQSTVVTAHQGSLNGERVVRGRETECAEYYQVHPVHAA